MYRLEINDLFKFNKNDPLYKIISKSNQKRHSRENGWFCDYYYNDNTNIQYKRNILNTERVIKYVFE